LEKRKKIGERGKIFEKKSGKEEKICRFGQQKIFQLCSPFILIVIPACIFIYNLIIQDNVKQSYVAVGFLVCTLYGFVNGFVTLIFIGPYRKRVKQQLIDPILRVMCIWKRVYAVQALAWDNIVARPKNVTVG
jgi:hypothetical protein